MATAKELIREIIIMFRSAEIADKAAEIRQQYNVNCAYRALDEMNRIQKAG